MASRAKSGEAESRQASEALRVAEQRAQGTAALDKHNEARAAKTDKDRAEDEALATEQRAEVIAGEKERAAAEQERVREILAKVEAPANARLLAPGTVIQLSGEDGELVTDGVFNMLHGHSEQHFASVLARNPKNLALNADRLRLLYSGMNGTLLPISDQRLSAEEMTDAERALFGLK